MEVIEDAGRVCWKSEDKKEEGSAERLIDKLKRKGHTSVLEHIHPSVRIITDRGVSHELVRHRLANYSQESTRYANYSKDKFGNEITVIRPVWYGQKLIDWIEKGKTVKNSEDFDISLKNRAVCWYDTCKKSENMYLVMLENGATPQEARSVLPNSLKTEIIMTANMREWRHIFSLRTSKAAHPQIREITQSLLEDFYKEWPVLFDDIMDQE